MIPKEAWISERIEEQEVRARLYGVINNLVRETGDLGHFSPNVRKESASLFSLNPLGGRIGEAITDRDTLMQVGVDVMKEFGLEEDRFESDTSRDDLNEEGARVVSNGAKQYRVYPSSTDGRIEFVREATFVKPSGGKSDKLDDMYVNNVKWSVRFVADNSYADNLP